ncbi:TPR Domain containing protein [Tritrichomonas foetus]|uniref:TPR Domain containing protein n=1 Tax=Tritrichomonas foetus TaxID=1144522 RepID=A0A1J4K4N2_9EUKA|nr:TPR Domain containing protein [Tritrichomonas foetus]|eukprot:OHT05808.1 TPR Domain containing protein [Tritrichomonas foetus]
MNTFINSPISYEKVAIGKYSCNFSRFSFFFKSMTDTLYKSLYYLRMKNFTKCAESCKGIGSSQQKEKWYIICKARTEESWTDFTEPDDLSAADYVFDENILTELPRPGTSLRTGMQTSRGTRPISTNGRPVSGYTHSSTSRGPSRSGTPTTSATSRFSRLATASLAFSGDEPDVTSMNVAKFSRNPFLSRILVDYLIHRLRDPIRAVTLAADCTKVHGFDDWWWKNRLGRSYYLLGLFPEAEQQFRSSLTTSPNIESRLELSKLYVRIDQPVKAMAELDNGLEQFPREYRFMLSQARLSDQLGNTIKAREIWRNVLKIDQASIEAIANLGAVTYYEDQPETASIFYSYLRRLGIVNSAVMNNIAMTALGAGDYSSVGPAIVAALSLATDSDEKAQIWYNISHIALTAGDLNLAHQALLISTALSLNCAEAFNNLGLLELRRRNTQKSLAAFRAATEANPEIHEPWFNMALVYQRVGQLQEAYIAASEAVKLFPLFVEANELLHTLEQQMK